MVKNVTARVKREIWNHKYRWVIRENGKIVSSQPYHAKIKKETLVNQIRTNDLSLNSRVEKRKLVKVIETFDTRKNAKILKYDEETKKGSYYQFSLKTPSKTYVVRSLAIQNKSNLRKIKAQTLDNFYDILTASFMGDAYKGKDDNKFKRIKKELMKDDVIKRDTLEGIVSYKNV